jgi:hypothetical protein
MKPDPRIPVSPATEDKLPFVRQPMVDWFSPRELARAGLLSAMAKMFGAYADNREIQALRPARSERDSAQTHGATADYSDLDDMWIDYVADLGDGWNPTYAIAYLLGQQQLNVGGHETQRGRVLIMGGDQVYPTATREHYENRLEGPYRCALAWVDEAQQKPPNLYAVPGNHDWYDGLTSFTRVFCQGRWLGGWKTRQARSYFALKLPHDWWLWGIDIQLSADIDEPQLTYFRTLAATMEPRSKIILCVAEPAWVTAARKGATEYDRIAFFEAETMTPFGHEHVVGLAGDLHAYARYSDVRQRQRFIAGGGGAYLYPTHRLPSTLELHSGKATDEDRAEERFELGADALFPPRKESWWLSLRSILFAWYSPGFAATLGIIYAFIAWLFNTAPAPAMQPLRAVTSLDQVASIMVMGLLQLPFAALAMLLLYGGLWSFADAQGVKKVALGTVHWLLHMTALAVAMLLSVQLQYHLLPTLQPVLFTLCMMTTGTLLGGAAWGIYLVLAHLSGNDVHSNEALVCQRRTDYKHFLRMHLTRDRLRIYPVGLRRVPQRWTYRPKTIGLEPWFVPAARMTLDPALIEDPIDVVLR